MRYENKVVIVAGKDTLISAACAKKLLDEGAKVVLYENSEAAFENLGEYKNNPNLRTIVVKDFTDDAELKTAGEWALAQFGAPDTVVTALTEPTGRGTIEDMPLELYQKVMDTVLTGTLFTLQPLIPPMIKIAEETGRHGSICVVMNIAGRTGIKGVNFAQAAAHAGLGGLIRNMATTLGKYHIVVNGVAAGPVEGDPEFDGFENCLGIIPGREKVTADDVAYGMMYVTDEYSGYNTGEILDVSCGRIIV